MKLIYCTFRKLDYGKSLDNQLILINHLGLYTVRLSKVYPLSKKRRKPSFSGQKPSPIDFISLWVCQTIKSNPQTNLEADLIRFQRLMGQNWDTILTSLKASFEWLWDPNLEAMNIFASIGF